MVGNIRILILEDRLNDADLIEWELSDAGLDVTIKRAMTEEEYLRALEEFAPDLILSDYNLPQYTGSLALLAAKKLQPQVPFILVTGAFDEHDCLYNEILAQGAKDCVLKKHLDQLATSVRKALDISGGNGNAAGERAAW